MSTRTKGLARDSRLQNVRTSPRAVCARSGARFVALAMHRSRRMPELHTRSRANVLLAHHPLDDVAHLVAMLEHRGYEVVAAHHGAPAVGAAWECAADVVVLHQRASGLEALHTQRALAAAGVRASVVIIAARGEVAWLARVSGTPHRVSRPVDPERLLVAIERAVDETRTGVEARGARPMGAER